MIIKGMTVYRPAWRSPDGTVRLEEARVVQRDSDGRYTLAFLGKDGRWRKKLGSVYLDVYASPEHYAAARKAREQADRVRKLERQAADILVRWCTQVRRTTMPQLDAVGQRLIKGRARLAKLEAKRDALAKPLTGGEA